MATLKLSGFFDTLATDELVRIALWLRDFPASFYWKMWSEPEDVKTCLLISTSFKSALDVLGAPANIDVFSFEDNSQLMLLPSIFQSSSKPKVCKSNYFQLSSSLSNSFPGRSSLSVNIDCNYLPSVKEKALRQLDGVYAHVIQLQTSNSWICRHDGAFITDVLSRCVGLRELSLSFNAPALPHVRLAVGSTLEVLRLDRYASSVSLLQIREFCRSIRNMFIRIVQCHETYADLIASYGSHITLATLYTPSKAQVTKLISSCSNLRLNLWRSSARRVRFPGPGSHCKFVHEVLPQMNILQHLELGLWVFSASSFFAKLGGAITALRSISLDAGCMPPVIAVFRNFVHANPLLEKLTIALDIIPSFLIPVGTGSELFQSFANVDEVSCYISSLISAIHQLENLQSVSISFHPKYIIPDTFPIDKLKLSV